MTSPIDVVLRCLREHADDTGLVQHDFELTHELDRLGIDNLALGQCIDALIERGFLAQEAADYYRVKPSAVAFGKKK
jgi:hypothetical protein